MTKLTFEEALERLNEQLPVNYRDVQAKALGRKVWLAEWHLPGCLSESQSFDTTKAEAIVAALLFADGENGPPRGMATALAKHGRFDHRTPLYGDVTTTIEQHTLGELL